MNSNLTLIKMARNGDDKAFNELIIKNLDLVQNIVSQIDCEPLEKDDIIQECYLMFIDFINEYLAKKPISNFRDYIKEKLNYYFDELVKTKHNKNSLETKENFCYVDDFITKLEDEELANELKKFMFFTDSFTFLQKTVLMAKFGFINNYVLKNVELAKAFNCSNNNISAKFISSKDKLQKLFKVNKVKFDDLKTDLSYYLSTSEPVVIYVINTYLNKEEIRVLKLVWGDDFSSLLDFKNINLSYDDIILYYNTIGKLYNIITSLNTEDMMSKLCLRECCILRK